MWCNIHFGEVEWECVRSLFLKLNWIEFRVHSMRCYVDNQTLCMCIISCWARILHLNDCDRIVSETSCQNILKFKHVYECEQWNRRGLRLEPLTIEKPECIFNGGYDSKRFMAERKERRKKKGEKVMKSLSVCSEMCICNIMRMKMPVS